MGDDIDTKEEFMEFIDYIVNKTGYIPYSD